MLEMLKERKAALEARGKKGFTLMEMLIVIAIIAVLVAIAIPVLGAQLEKSKEATDAANLRSAYAEVVASYLNDGAAHSETVALQSNVSDWQSGDMKIAGVDAESILKRTDSAKELTVEVDATGQAKIGGVAVQSALDQG